MDATTLQPWQIAVRKDHLGHAKLKGRAPWDDDDRRFLALGLCGEVGELANLVKKDWRGDAGDRRAGIAEELADSRIYLELLAGAWSFGLAGPGTVGGPVFVPTEAAHGRHFLALALCARAGQAVGIVEALWGGLPAVQGLLKGRLVDCRAHLDALAAAYGIDLDAACEAKLRVVYDRWSGGGTHEPSRPQGQTPPAAG